MIGRRFGRAFPELTKWFSWLNKGYAAGATWQGLLVSHVARIGKRRTLDLLCETRDVRRMGIPDTRNMEVLICDVLGLSQDVIKREAGTAGQAMAMLEHELAMLSP